MELLFISTKWLPGNDSVPATNVELIREMYLLEMSAFAVLLLGLSYVSEHSELIAFVEVSRRPEELQRKDTDPI